jgi:4-hydroxybenzoate polyprenyltransferase
MFLNDAFDADFDREYRRERPIPSGAITLDAVWRWGFILLGAGAVALILLGITTGLIAVTLLVCILAYDATHKLIASAPVLMAGCRFLLYIVAASSAADGITGLAIWSAFALASYVIGLSYLARRESTRGAISHWPCVLLLAPILLALIANGKGYERASILLCLVFGLWTAWCLSHTLLTTNPKPGRAVSGLLAGIVLVDLLAVAGGETIGITLAFIGSFAAALLTQRFVPAT